VGFSLFERVFHVKSCVILFLFFVIGYRVYNNLTAALFGSLLVGQEFASQGSRLFSFPTYTLLNLFLFFYLLVKVLRKFVFLHSLYFVDHFLVFLSP
jgi:hypothetical protein